MKKLILTSLASACMLAASAGVNYPTDFRKDFSDLSLEGWTVYAPEGKPATSLNNFFPNYSPSNAVSIMYGEEYAVWTLSQYLKGEVSDTWVITPEITITNDQEVLAFNIQVYGMTSTVNNNYAVYISEGGVAKEDFKEFETGSVKGSSGGANYINFVSKRYELSGYKGKKIRLAFVNSGNTIGMMGFGNIYVGSYYVDNFPTSSWFDYQLADKNKENNLAFNFRMSTPETVRAYSVDFKTSGGYTYSYENTSKSFRLGALTTTSIEIPYPQISGSSEDYTLTITPDFEGAMPTVITGKLISGASDYEYVGVMEEATGTWCGWCPYGAAALEYYSHLYNGQNGQPRAIAIAIHGANGDPMEISSKISDYYMSWMDDQEIEGFPAVCINRLGTVTPSTDPRVVGNFLSTLYPQGAYLSIKLNNVYYQPTESSEMIADFDLSTSFDTNSLPVNVSVIITEDNVEGTNTAYNQTSYVSSAGGDTEARIKSRLGADWVPYFEPFFGVDAVNYRNIQYNHVARAAYPSYKGYTLPSVGQGETYNGRINFQMPTNVKIKENTNVVILITNAGTNEILSADEMSYDNFTFASGVNTVEAADNVRVSLENGILTVNSDSQAEINVWSIDGANLLNATAQAGTSSYAIDKTNKVVVVKVRTANGVKTYKLIN